jgi:hypothetical protein
MTSAELTDNLFERLKQIKPVNVMGKAPILDDVRALLPDYKQAKGADEAWVNNARRK